MLKNHLKQFTYDNRRPLADVERRKELVSGDIEKRTGLLRCYISRVENGHTVPAVETIEKFARALEVPIYQLFYDGEEPLLPPRLTPAGLRIEKMSLAQRASRALKIAERIYYSSPNAVPVRVFTYRDSAQTRKLTPHGMAVELVEYVKLQLRRTEKSIFRKLDRVPEGFGIIQIDRRGGKEWNCGRTYHDDYSKIFEAFASRVTAKNTLVEKYRANLPGSEIWLLVYSGVQVARRVSIPAGADTWVVPTTFDKVLFFSSLPNPQLIEIARS